MTQPNSSPVPVQGTNTTQIFKPLELTPPRKVEPEDTPVEPVPTNQGETISAPPSKFLELTPPKQT